MRLRVEKLTRQQLRVFQLVAQGRPNKIIAHQLAITETTVKAHVGTVLRKLGMYSRPRAIAVFGKIDINFKRDEPTAA